MDEIRPPFGVLSQNEGEVLPHTSRKQRHFLVSQISIVNLLVVEPLAGTLVQTLHQEVSDALEMPLIHPDSIRKDIAANSSSSALAHKLRDLLQRQLLP